MTCGWSGSHRDSHDRGEGGAPASPGSERHDAGSDNQDQRCAGALQEATRRGLHDAVAVAAFTLGGLIVNVADEPARSLPVCTVAQPALPRFCSCTVWPTALGATVTVTVSLLSTAVTA